MIRPNEYPATCPQCSNKMPGLGFFFAKSHKVSVVLYWISVPSIAAWVIGLFLANGDNGGDAGGFLIVGGNVIGALITCVIYLGPGILLILLGMCLPHVKHAKCDNCGFTIKVRAPNSFGK